MSEASPSVPGMVAVHPWRRLREAAHILLVWHDGGVAGESDFEAGTISLRRGMTWAERRSTVQHELLHWQRGASLTTYVDQDEERVCREAARQLIPDVKVLGEAMAWADQDLRVAADELGVDVDTLRFRLRHLHPAERHYLTRRLAD